MKNKDTFLATVHLALVLLAWCSWFLFNWIILVIGAGLYYLQLKIFGNCVLTKAQFKDKEASFHDYILRKIGIKFNPKKMIFFTDYLFPLTILSFMVLWQLLLKHKPILA